MVPLELPAEHRGDRGDGRRYLGDHQKGWLLRFDFRGCLSGAAGSISFPHEAETDTIEQVASEAGRFGVPSGRKGLPVRPFCRKGHSVL